MHDSRNTLMSSSSMIKKILTLIAILFLLAVAWLLFWPVPVDPVAWTPPTAPGYTGVHAQNHLLADLELIPLDDELGPEHVVMASDSKLYVAVLSGRILRMNPDGSDQQVFADTGGRVLGFDFDQHGNMIAADANSGLLSISPDGQISMLTDTVNGEPIRYANAVVVANNGKIYFSDSSQRFAPAERGGTFNAAMLDIIEQQSTGRVLEYDPDSQKTRVVVKGLSFANGVALSADQSTLFVVETGRYRIWKVSLDAQDLSINQASPMAQLLFDNLPGYPDNLLRGMDGKIWLGFTGPRSPPIDAMAEKPLLRKMVLRLPKSLWPKPKNYGHVMAFTDNGEVVADLQDPSGAYPQSTGVSETPERLYIQNLHLGNLGWKEKPVQASSN